MKSRFLSCALGITALCALGVAGPAIPRASLTAADRAFADKLAQINTDEISLGKLAQQNGTIPAVKDFGARMVQEHTELNNQLQTWAKENNISVPSRTSQAEATQRQRLAALSGSVFDKAYIEDMLSGHQQAIETVQREAEQATNPQIKELAARTLPVLEDHIRWAEYHAGQMGIAAKPGLNEPEEPNKRPPL